MMSFRDRHKHYLKHQGHINSVDQEMKRKADPKFQALEQENKTLRNDYNKLREEMIKLQGGK